MQKFILTLLLGSTMLLNAEIIQINNIDEIRSLIKENTLCLFDIDDTLIDNPSCLGSPPWRSWVRPQFANWQLEPAIFDALTLYIAKKAPYKAVESSTSALIADLQKEGVAAFGFTARGRSQWYGTDVAGVDKYTHAQLKRVGIDFSKSLIPADLVLDESFYYDGIIFARHIPKGELLDKLSINMNYIPQLIIFVDDRLEQIESVDAALEALGIPSFCCWYCRSALDRNDFNPLVSTIQLEYLLHRNTYLSDEDAAKLANESPNINPEAHLKEILNVIDREQIRPVIEL